MSDNRVIRFYKKAFRLFLLSALSSVVVLGAVIWAVYAYRREIRSVIISILGL